MCLGIVSNMSLTPEEYILLIVQESLASSIEV